MTEAEIVESMVGRTIIAARYEDTAWPGQEWCGHEEVTLTLDDGRIVNIAGWGHDAWGVVVALIDQNGENQ